MIPVRAYERRLEGVVHLALDGTYDITYYIVCEGEDTKLAWERCWVGTTPTCLWCIAGVLRDGSIP
jgi:hypothetical protein